MSIELVTVLLFGALLAALFLGLPMAFSMGGLAVLFAVLMMGPQSLPLIALQVFGGMNQFTLAAIPLFIFMAAMLSRSGVTDAFYEMMHRFMGSLRGGLAMGTVLVSDVFAAMCGSSLASTTAVGMATLPSLRKYKYDNDIALGSIMAGGALGILIPPSVPMIILGFVGETSVGKLFIGGILPGLLLSALFIIYIGVKCFFKPSLGPPVPIEERATWGQKIASLRLLVLPLFVIFMVLGTILTGIATPTEAAAMGALGSIICAAANRRLGWRVMKDTCYETLAIGSMVAWIMFAAMAFTMVYHSLGAEKLVVGVLKAVPFGRWGVIVMTQVILFFLGMFLSSTGIILITAPIFFAVIRELGFDPVWFGVLFTMNLEMAFLTPPFGPNLFAMKAIARDIGMREIVHSVWPFVGLQTLGLVIVMIFPQVVLWLPNLMMK